mgnify:FL=1
MHPTNGPITFILAKRKALDGYTPDFGGPGYYRMKKSMHDECMSDAHETEIEAAVDTEVKTKADPKHKQTVKTLRKTAEALYKASRLHGEQAETLEGLAATLERSSED